ncbi:MAG: DUF362 domain-containing protein [Acidobacteriota bacterium]
MKSLLANLDVALVSGDARYPAESPFHPPEIYPEYPYEEKSTDPDNKVYTMVRDSFRLLGMDKANFGRPDWNPLGEVISPGQRVLIKPNFVLHFNAGPGPLDAVITHPSVIRAICDYVVIALRDGGELVVGDAPQMNCDFARLCNVSGIDVLATYLESACARRSIALRLVDFRQEQTRYKYGIVWERKALNNGESVRVTLGENSFMETIDGRLLYGADYCRRETVQAHEGHHHEYVVARHVLSSDVVISVPKLKVHRKVGTTLNLKNIVGINTDKNHLAHYRIGSPAGGGDEFYDPRWEDRAERVLSDILLGRNWRFGKYPFLAWRTFRKALGYFTDKSARPSFSYGNWYGNDTAWRMVLDLNRILLFADAEGRLQDRPARKYFSVIDGVIGGEGEGPLHPAAYPSGVVLAGFNPLAVDWVATRLMGFDSGRIPLYRQALEQVREWVPDFAVEGIRVLSNIASWEGIMQARDVVFSFRAPAGWRGKIELQEPAAERDPQEETAGGMLSQ